MGKITVCLDEPQQSVIAPELYGHFAEHLGTCVNGGLWVGEDSPVPNLGGIRSDVIEALRAIRVPVLRWPGGCFADDYHWADGIGPRGQRPHRVNIHWGYDIETNAFGTHEFIQLCRLIGAEPYLAGNLGSGSVREMRDWIEYCNFAGPSTLARQRGANGSPMPLGVRYFGVGNENWGCGGHFCPEDYAAEYKRYSTYLRDFSGTNLFLIAGGPDGNKPEWTRRFFEKLGGYRRIGGFAAHYYCGAAGTATQFSADQWYELIDRAARIENLIVEQRAIMDEFDPRRRIGLVIDEWGAWHPPTPGRRPEHLWQQSTLRDALIAAVSLDAFNRNADKIVMANIAQMLNVLQALILTREEKMVLTPTYHVYQMYQSHQGGRGARLEIESDNVRFAAEDGRARTMPTLSGSASVRGRELTLSIVNAHASLPAHCVIEIRGGPALSRTEATQLTHDEVTAHNTFESPDELRPSRFEVDKGSPWCQTFPPASVTVLRCAI